MLRYLYADELHKHPRLAEDMFRDRADQFKTRLGWDVQVNEKGEERDRYDDLNPLYVIWEEEDGGHGGSMRFLPTTGPAMVNDVFGHLTGGAPICSPLIWEVTRFCLSRTASPCTAGAIMLSGGEVMEGFGLTHIAGVFDARMVRIYRLIGSSPEILGSQGVGRDQVSVGLWPFSQADCARVAERAGIPRELSRLWFNAAFGKSGRPRFARSA
ncbi:autoinducer synthase [Ruegeria sediminis]|uniref:Acyl-homoserine-lactone synthase n=1 Tax=Ruegeria sediminis TaxID=2583820 RepID=A0ABY2X5U4_9RHOB|nr:acyl-homoserine-lactone synthase [Ruegeria sediminis]TMV10197.1 autoinducer synthase [Ruegeria sediminis]